MSSQPLISDQDPVSADACSPERARNIRFSVLCPSRFWRSVKISCTRGGRLWTLVGPPPPPPSRPGEGGRKRRNRGSAREFRYVRKMCPLLRGKDRGWMASRTQRNALRTICLGLPRGNFRHDRLTSPRVYSEAVTWVRLVGFARMAYVFGLLAFGNLARSASMPG